MVLKPTAAEYSTPGASSSAFYDRAEPYFVAWLERQGLSPDASDHLIAESMATYLAETGKPSIQPEAVSHRRPHLPDVDLRLLG